MIRNLIYETPLQLKKAYAIPTSSTIWSGGITQPSMNPVGAGYMDIAENLRNFDLEDVHVEGAERIADAVAKYDIDRFIHMSSHNADKNSSSEFYRTKVWKYLIIR